VPADAITLNAGGSRHRPNASLRVRQGRSADAIERFYFPGMLIRSELEKQGVLKEAP
jgi:hypothetical protein